MSRLKISKERRLNLICKVEESAITAAVFEVNTIFGFLFCIISKLVLQNIRDALS